MRAVKYGLILVILLILIGIHSIYSSNPVPITWVEAYPFTEPIVREDEDPRVYWLHPDQTLDELYFRDKYGEGKVGLTIPLPDSGFDVTDTCELVVSVSSNGLDLIVQSLAPENVGSTIATYSVPNGFFVHPKFSGGKHNIAAVLYTRENGQTTQSIVKISSEKTDTAVEILTSTIILDEYEDSLPFDLRWKFTNGKEEIAWAQLISLQDPRLLFYAVDTKTKVVRELNLFDFNQSLVTQSTHASSADTWVQIYKRVCHPRG